MKTAEEILNPYIEFGCVSKNNALKAMEEYAEEERQKAFNVAQEQNMFNKLQARYNSFEEYKTNNPLS